MNHVRVTGRKLEKFLPVFYVGKARWPPVSRRRPWSTSRRKDAWRSSFSAGSMLQRLSADVSGPWTVSTNYAPVFCTAAACPDRGPASPDRGHRPRGKVARRPGRDRQQRSGHGAGSPLDHPRPVAIAAAIRVLGSRMGQQRILRQRETLRILRSRKLIDWEAHLDA
jgi:hypothetical protein